MRRETNRQNHRKAYQMKRLLLLLALITAIPTFAQTKTLVNVDRNGLALRGYDPVAFFTQSRPVKGLAQFESKYNGARAIFHRATVGAKGDMVVALKRKSSSIHVHQGLGL